MRTEYIREAPKAHWSWNPEAEGRRKLARLVKARRKSLTILGAVLLAKLDGEKFDKEALVEKANKIFCSAEVSNKSREKKAKPGEKAKYLCEL